MSNLTQNVIDNLLLGLKKQSEAYLELIDNSALSHEERKDFDREISDINRVLTEITGNRTNYTVSQLENLANEYQIKLNDLQSLINNLDLGSLTVDWNSLTPEAKEFLKGEKGDKGENGKSNYELAKVYGFLGSEVEYLSSLKGSDGKDGLNGVDGKDGLNGVDGKDGLNGLDGTGVDLHQELVLKGYDKSKDDFLNKIKDILTTNLNNESNLDLVSVREIFLDLISFFGLVEIDNKDEILLAINYKNMDLVEFKNLISELIDNVDIEKIKDLDLELYENLESTYNINLEEDEGFAVSKDVYFVFSLFLGVYRSSWNLDYTATEKFYNDVKEMNPNYSLLDGYKLIDALKSLNRGYTISGINSYGINRRFSACMSDDDISSFHFYLAQLSNSDYTYDDSESTNTIVLPDFLSMSLSEFVEYYKNNDYLDYLAIDFLKSLSIDPVFHFVNNIQNGYYNYFSLSNLSYFPGSYMVESDDEHRGYIFIISYIIVNHIVDSFGIIQVLKELQKLD